MRNSPELVKEHINQECQMIQRVIRILYSDQFEYDDDLNSEEAVRLARAIVANRNRFKEVLE